MLDCLPQVFRSNVHLKINVILQPVALKVKLVNNKQMAINTGKSFSVLDNPCVRKTFNYYALYFKKYFPSLLHLVFQFRRAMCSIHVFFMHGRNILSN